MSLKKKGILDLAVRSPESFIEMILRHSRHPNASEDVSPKPDLFTRYLAPDVAEVFTFPSPTFRLYPPSVPITKNHNWLAALFLHQHHSIKSPKLRCIPTGWIRPFFAWT